MSEKEKNLSKEFVEHFKEDQALDTTEVFDQLIATRNSVWGKITAQLPTREDQKNSDLRKFNDLNGDYIGQMQNFYGVGNPIDWVIHSNIGSPKKTFTNIHLTTYLDQSVDTPHLGFALGTLPDVFFYIDLMPRVDVLREPDYLQKYLAPLNDTWLELQEDMFAAGIKPFSAVMPFIRSSLSPVAMVGIVPMPFFKEKIEPKMQRYVDYWLELMKKAEPLNDPEYQQKLLHDDTLIRNNIVNLDPANAIAERLVGQELADRLFGILRGEERSPRT